MSGNTVYLYKPATEAICRMGDKAGKMSKSPFVGLSSCVNATLNYVFSFLFCTEVQVHQSQAVCNLRVTMVVRQFANEGQMTYFDPFEQP